MSQFSYRLAIIGSRQINNYQLVQTTVSKLFDVKNINCIISGGAKGVDTLARNYAIVNDVKLKQYFPDWDKYGKSAGFKRNDLIVNQCDCLIAFWDGKSKGSLNSITTAMGKGIPTLTINLERKKYNNSYVDARYCHNLQFFLGIKK